MNLSFSSSKHNNNDSTSGSGGESGWTMYLEQSFISSSYHQYPTRNGNHQDQWIYDTTTHEDDDQLDLSMVSDASSGPYNNNNNLQEDNHEQDYCRFNPDGKSVRKTKKDKGFYHQSLDDTASSNPTHNLSIQKEEVIYSSSKVSAENSMESNGRQFKGKSTSVKKSYSRSSVK